MTENRIRYYCRNCKHAWLIEPKKPEWQGTREAFAKFEKENGRKFNHCYCGEPIYGGKINEGENFRPSQKHKSRRHGRPNKRIRH